MPIDIGDTPTGTPPTTGEKLQIRTAIGLGQTDAPTFLAQSLTGQSLTGTQATSLVDLAATWNTTGNPSLIYGRVTNTNSGTTANLIDLGTFAGGSLFKVNKAGGIRSIPSDNSSPAIGGILGTNIGAATVALYFGYTQAGSVHAYLDDAAFILRSTSYFGFSSNQPGIQSADTTLFRDAAGILAQRNGTAKQTLRIYNTYTSATVYERAVMDWNGPTPGNLQIGTEFMGSGSGMAARPIDFVTGGVRRGGFDAAGNVDLLNVNVTGSTMPAVGIHQPSSNTLAFSVASVLCWRITNTGVFEPGLNSNFDIGSNANRPRNVYMGSWIRMAVTTVSALPAATTAGAGARMFVNDALTPVFGSAVVGLGSVTVPVYSTGSAWNVG